MGKSLSLRRLDNRFEPFLSYLQISDNFKMDVDHNNKEIIFAVPFDSIYAGFTQFAKWYPPVARLAFGATYQCWGGSCANPQFINSYQQGDKRLEKTWLMGPQYNINTWRIGVDMRKLIFPH